MDRYYLNKKWYLKYGIIIIFLSIMLPDLYYSKENEILLFFLIAILSTVFLMFKSPQFEIAVTDSYITYKSPFKKNDISINISDIASVELKSIASKRRKVFHEITLRSQKNNQIIRYGGYWKDYETLTEKLIQRVSSNCVIDGDISKYIFLLKSPTHDKPSN